VRASTTGGFCHCDNSPAAGGPHSVLFGIHNIAFRQKRLIPTLRKEREGWGTHDQQKAAEG
jgi:hypothetical protein